MSTVNTPYTEITGSGPVLITCEHATQRLPEGWEWPDADQRLVGTHWAYDLGASEIVHELAAELGCAAVLSNFTRLLIDPNRELSSTTLFRPDAEGQPVELNQALDDHERERRIDGFYRPYHEAIARTAAAFTGHTMLSVHTFTPEYEGQIREVEFGVLFDSKENEAKSFGEALVAAGFTIEYNEPWSGKNGLMYSVEHHANTNGKIGLEIEVRQDRAVDPAYRQKLVRAIAAYFASSR